MRILHIFDHSLPLHSGYTFRSAAILRAQRALGWETLHLTSPKQGETAAARETVDGLDFYRTPPPAPAGIAPWRQIKATSARLFEVARECRPDILHAHSPVLNVFPALWVGRRLGIPVVYEIRAFWEDAAVDHGTTREGSLRYRLTRGLETLAAHRVAHVLTICEGLRADLAARGIDAGRITVIPNAVDVESFQPSGEADPALRRSLGLEGARVVGFIGSFYAYEGLDLLLDAWPGLLAAFPDLRLLLVGGGPQDARLKAQAARLGVADKVIFTGRVPHNEVNRYYDLIDLLAYPRHAMRLTELVTPLKPLEAMAQERVFVASDVGGHKELIRDGETGRLFKAGDAGALAGAIVDMFGQRERWPDMKRAARRFVEDERNWASSVANYRAVYAALTGK
ncbi:MAG: glycosyltransferase, exosortase A system-associated [Azoarcus sp.]|jgi:PEP-CTERM/exosortase A-associated glycosyltransferase|nr:glycosyltransferase, exosortase A system-associated [Azoarcus sp.]